MKLFLDDGGSGKGAPLVLLHGLGADSTVWSAQLEHLRENRRVLAPDLRGHGRSDRAAEYTVQSIVDDLLETLPALGEKFWLAGHSFAGSVVSRFAGPETKRRMFGAVARMDPAATNRAFDEVLAWTG
jgi:pimeloyl-ACP methyl ester carboxylesterase